MNITQGEIENRTTLYALISRLMIMEVEHNFLDFIESNGELLELFPNYKDWGKRREFSSKILKERYLDVDYANLFLLHLVPYESFYIRDDQMIESGGDNPVLGLYNSFDFRVELDKARVVSPDHIIGTTSSTQARAGEIFIYSADDILNQGTVKKTATEAELTMMLEICALNEYRADIKFISMVPKNILDVENGLTPEILEAMPNLLKVVLGELEKLDIKLKPKNSLSFSNIKNIREI